MSVLLGTELTAMQFANFSLISSGLVQIQGGTFIMGSTALPNAQPTHHTTISTFMMGATPVTNREYTSYLNLLGDRRVALIDDSPSRGMEKLFALGDNKAIEKVIKEIEFINPMEGSFRVVEIKDHKPSEGFDRPTQPAVEVSWYEALVYALLHGATLPTEWQWEYAARVVLGQECVRKYATPSGELTKSEVHYGADSTADVDDTKYPTLENGLRHMTGNVWEWMRNWFGEYPRGAIVDPTGPISGERKVLRGGSWDDHGVEVLDANYRLPVFPVGHDDSVGFRVVASPKD